MLDEVGAELLGGTSEEGVSDLAEHLVKVFLAREGGGIDEGASRTCYAPVLYVSLGLQYPQECAYCGQSGLRLGVAVHNLPYRHSLCALPEDIHHLRLASCQGFPGFLFRHVCCFFEMSAAKVGSFRLPNPLSPNKMLLGLDF